jgi:hypothetical protein
LNAGTEIGLVDSAVGMTRVQVQLQLMDHVEVSAEADYQQVLLFRSPNAAVNIHQQ